jgi:NTE family protein
VRIGLVLGAGGVAGGAWHAGVLAALAEATGWDARDAEVVVGTSAGSVTGASLRAGLSGRDLHAGAIGRSLSPEGARLLARARTAVEFRLSDRVGGFRRPANPTLLRRLASLSPRPGIALAGLLPPGQVDASAIGHRIEELAGGPAWPARPLWIVAVRLGDGQRVVFGRDAEAPLGAAVAASCAIPGFFSPVHVDGHHHVDGGAHSTTSADLLAGLGLDLVVVSAPMAGRWRSLRPHPAALSRAAARVALDGEVAAVRRAGTPVLVLQPGPADTPIMDGRAMDPGARGPVAERAWTSTLERLATYPGPRPAP